MGSEYPVEDTAEKREGSASVGSSQTTEPHLEDGSAYRQLRPTRLDKIKNF